MMKRNQQSLSYELFCLGKMIEVKIAESNNKYKERKITLDNNVENLINNINMFVLDSTKEKEFYVIDNDLYTK